MCVWASWRCHRHHHRHHNYSSAHMHAAEDAWYALVIYHAHERHTTPKDILSYLFISFSFSLFLSLWSTQHTNIYTHWHDLFDVHSSMCRPGRQFVEGEYSIAHAHTLYIFYLCCHHIVLNSVGSHASLSITSTFISYHQAVAAVRWFSSSVIRAYDVCVLSKPSTFYVGIWKY